MAHEIGLIFVISIILVDYQWAVLASPCRKSNHGMEYSGTLAWSASGRLCTYWAKIPNFFPKYKTVLLTKNYCRNPDKDKKGPWCFVSRIYAPNITHNSVEYCSIPRCPDEVGCFNGRGQRYEGKQDRTRNNKMCLKWYDVRMRAGKRWGFLNKMNFPKLSLRKADNFCRNPDGDSDGPWCFYQGNNNQKCPKNFCRDNCAIPVCKRKKKMLECRTTKLGTEFGGTTKLKYKTCMYWSELNLNLTDSMFPDGSVDAAENNCRNPTRDAKGPYCYVRLGTRPAIKFNCDVPACYVKDKDRLASMAAFPIPLSDACPSQFVALNRKLIATRPNNLPKNILISIKKYALRAGPQITYKVDSKKNIHLTFYYKFCVSKDMKYEWPSGDYCLYLLSGDTKYPSSCPEDFQHVTYQGLSINQGSLKTNGSFPFNVEAMRRLHHVKWTFCCRTDIKDRPHVLKNQLTASSDINATFAVMSRRSKCPSMNNTQLHHLKSPLSVLQNFGFHYDMSGKDIQECFYTKEKPDKRPVKSARFIVNGHKCPPKFLRSSFSFNASIAVWRGLNLCTPKEPNTNLWPDQRYCLPHVNASCPKGFAFQSLDLIGKEKSTFFFCCRNPIRLTSGKWPWSVDQPIILIQTNHPCPVFSNLHVTPRTMPYFNVEDVRNIGGLQLGDYFSVGRRFNLKLCLYKKIRRPPPMGRFPLSMGKSGVACPFLTAPATQRPLEGLPYPPVRVCIVFSRLYPKGSYCGYRSGTDCPPGFSESSINQSANTEGTFSFCCRRDAHPSSPMYWLHKSADFVLFAPVNTTCQKIKGMAVTQFKSQTSTANLLSPCTYSPYTDLDETKLWWPVYKNCPTRRGFLTRTGWYLMNQRYRSGCMAEVSGSMLPHGDYCFVAMSRCPSAFSKTERYPLTDLYICCSSKLDSTAPTTWPKSLKNFAVLSRNITCPQFKGYTLQDLKLERWEFRSLSIGIRGIFGIRRQYTPNQKTIGFCHYSTTRFKELLTWPAGRYSLPKPVSDCPKKFGRGAIFHRMERNDNRFSHSMGMHLDGNYKMAGNTLEWAFCTRNDSVHTSELPPGHYCLFRVGGKCPKGFGNGTVQVVEDPYVQYPNQTIGSDFYKRGATPDIKRDGVLLSYFFCCRQDYSSPMDPISLPTEDPFYLFRLGPDCQQVSGMRATQEFLCIDAEDSPVIGNQSFDAPYFLQGLTPITGTYQRGCDFQINMCYYAREKPTKPTTMPTVPSGQPPLKDQWPQGSYALIRTHGEACPSGFERGIVYVATTLALAQDKDIFFWADDDNHGFEGYHGLMFCVQSRATGPAWPPGQYCLVMNNDCPSKFHRYAMRSLNDVPIQGHVKTVPDSFRQLQPSLCCRNDADSGALQLPSSQAFILIKYPTATSCPQVKDMQLDTYQLSNGRGIEDTLCYFTPYQTPGRWPAGHYMLPIGARANYSCPQGFVRTRHVHLTQNQPDKVLEFCVRSDKVHRENDPWPDGRYCVFTMEQNCPKYMYPRLNEPVRIPDYSCCRTNKEEQWGEMPSLYRLCCRLDDQLVMQQDPTQSVYLLGTPQCSDIHGMQSVPETQYTPLRAVRNFKVQPPFVTAASWTLCYYAKNSYGNQTGNCGCHANAICDSAGDCHCQSGYFGDGVKKCVKVTNSSDQCMSLCHQNATCVTKGTTKRVSRCVCSSGFAGDGFTCSPDCSTLSCASSMHCIIENGEAKCECNANKIPYKDHCHGNVMSSLMEERTIRQFLLNNLKCLTAEDKKGLSGFDTTLFYAIFVPPENLTACDEVLFHIGVFNKSSKQEQNSPSEFLMMTLSGDYVRITEKKTTVEVNGVLCQKHPVLFINGIIHYVDQKLPHLKFVSDRTKSSRNRKPLNVTAISLGTALMIILIVALIVGLWVYRKSSQSNMGFLRMPGMSDSNPAVHFSVDDDSVNLK